VTIWFTADLHLGHRNIVDYCNRPFRDVEAMNDALMATSTTVGSSTEERSTSQSAPQPTSPGHSALFSGLTGK
jgi:hypothetical protein